MKRFIGILFLLTVFSYLKAQENISCEQQRENAIQDTENGIYKIQRNTGQRTADQLKFDFYFRNYLFTTFNIEYYDLGCVIGLPLIDSCYWVTMDSLFLRKFGENFIGNQYRKINDSYWNLTEKEKSKVLSKKKAFMIHELEKQVEFVGDTNAIKKYFIETYSIPDSIFNNWLNVLEIGIDGKVENYRLNAVETEIEYKPILISKEQKLRDLEFINKLGEWKPGYIYGVKVKSEFFL